MVNLDQAQRYTFLKKLCPRSHWEIIRVIDAATQYVMKDDTRIAGPWEFGIKPLVKRNKASVAEARAERADDNKAIIEMGARAAVEQGFIKVDNYDNLARSINRFKLDGQ